MSTAYTHPRPWADMDWIAVGDRVELTVRPKGEIYRAYGLDPDSPALRGGARGIVIKAPSGGWAPHDCPDHELGPDDCVCGDDGVVPGRATSATVRWELDDGSTRDGLIYARGGGLVGDAPGHALPWRIVDPGEWVNDCARGTDS